MFTTTAKVFIQYSTGENRQYGARNFSMAILLQLYMYIIHVFNFCTIIEYADTKNTFKYQNNK